MCSIGVAYGYPLYIFVGDNVCVVAYAPKYKVFAETVRGKDVRGILAAAEQTFGLAQRQLMCFSGEVVRSFGDARILRTDDYPLYEAFFRTAYPQASPEGWLYEYFAEKTAKEYFAGYIADGKLVSVCDAPDMPYMENLIQHTGIHTLPAERRKGFGRLTAALAAHHLAERGICPQWDCSADNTASVGLARSIGYVQFGKAYIVEERE